MSVCVCVCLCLDISSCSVYVSAHDFVYFALLSFLFCVSIFSHQTQTTCWDHPKMTELYQSLGIEHSIMYEDLGSRLIFQNKCRFRKLLRINLFPTLYSVI